MTFTSRRVGFPFCGYWSKRFSTRARLPEHLSRDVLHSSALNEKKKTDRLLVLRRSLEARMTIYAHTFTLAAVLAALLVRTAFASNDGYDMQA